MPFTVVRNDITKMRVDAIVNTANPRPLIGSGTDAMIHAAAGPELLKARQAIGPMSVGDAQITPAYDLNANYVIHTVGPVWQDGNRGEGEKLRSCYANSLRLAREHGCESVAFPLISTGNYGFPKDKALQIAISVFSAFLLEQDMEIYLVVFNRQAFRLSEKLFAGVRSYIDQHYVDLCESAARAGNREMRRRRMRDEAYVEARSICEMPAAAAEVYAAPAAPMMPRPVSLEELLKKADAGFTQRLNQLIDERGLKNSTVYKKANISKQHFSKLINDPHAKPTKPTAIALALALELNLQDTRDLLQRAGYALTNSSIFDLIIMYHIENKIFNVVEINCVLYEYDQSLLGA